MKGTTGEDETAQGKGGNILRSSGRKDRHNKVYTTKGLRDRRLRLSAHTAIQFYDVQDRLGFDRPSKAVDWLIDKAKNAIDKLYSNPGSNNELNLDQQQENPNYGYALIQPDSTDPSGSSSSFVHPDGNTMKSFFPTSSMSFPNFSNDVMPRGTSFQAEDLGLSLHTLQAENHENSYDNPILSGSNIVEFQESFQRMVYSSWNGRESMEDSRIGFLTSSQAMPRQEILAQDLPFSQRELLQSDLALHPWNERPFVSMNHSESSQFGNRFELGFRVPARIYGDEEPETRSSLNQELG